MKKLALLLSTLLGLTLLAGCSSGGSVQTVDASTFLSTAEQPGVVMVDVRTPSEYAAGHIDGAINVDVEAAGFDTQIGILDKDATYAVYCRSGRRSSLATDAMAKAGFVRLYNLSGGIADLQSAGGQVVTS